MLFLSGIGHYTTEEIIFNEEGRLLTDRTWNYKPPGAKDIPLNFRIKFPDRNPNPLGILKSKGRTQTLLHIVIIDFFEKSNFFL